jgi:hypothetical protein
MAIDVDWNPDNKKLKEFGWVSAIGFSVIGFLFLPSLRWLHGLGAEEAVLWMNWNWKISQVLLGVGLVIWILSLISTKAVRPIYIFWMAVAFPIGWTISHIVLGLLYFLMFTPLAIVFRLAGRDALERRIDKQAASYWVHREGTPPASRYVRQF